MQKRKKTKYKHKGLKPKKLKILKKRIRNSSFFNNAKLINFGTIISEKEIMNYQLNIRITTNNVFCTLKNLRTNKILLVRSAGIYKLNVSKKNLKFLSKLIIQKFIDEIKDKFKIKLAIIILTSPIKNRKIIIKQLKQLYIKGSKFIIKVNELKVFNGCRPKKKKRKKQKGLRIFK